MRRVLLVAVLVVSFALTAALAFGDSRQTVVRIGDCSGVCVDPRGFVFTAKHCDHQPTETVMFLDRQVTAQRIYVTEEVEGPVVFDCEGDGYPYEPLADQVPERGSIVSTSGYPAIGGKRVFRQETGQLLRGSNFTFRGQPFFGNIVDVPLIGGWSGGPLFNERGEVCGLLSASDEKESVFITFEAVRKAYDAVKAEKPTLYVFTTRTCAGCVRFKSDYDSDFAFRSQLQSSFRVEFVDADLRPDLAQQNNVVEVPTFVVPNQVRVQGYPGKQALVDRLLTQTDERVPISESAEIEWSHVAIVLLAAEQEASGIRGTIRSRLLDLATGPLQRRVAEATEGKAALTVVAERTEPERFAMLSRAAGVNVERFHVLVLVTKQDLGIKGVIAGVVEKVIDEHLGEVPVDLIFERVHPDDYARVVSALHGVEPEPGEQKFPVQESILGGMLAILTERLKLIGKVTTWWQRRKER